MDSVCGVLALEYSEFLSEIGAMSAYESALSDTEDDPVFRDGAGDRKRLRSVDDIVQDIEGKKQRITSPKETGKQGKSRGKKPATIPPGVLDEMKVMVDSSIKGAVDSLWEKIDRKIDQKIASLENKMEKLQSQVFEKEQLIDELRTKDRLSQERLAGLEEQVEEMERNSRSSNLIFWSKQLGKRSEREDVEAMTIKLINESFPTKFVTKQDFAAIHRLPGDNTVICSFNSKNLRNELYSERFTLNRREVAAKGKVFVNESLTKSKREIFSKLLELKRQGEIWTAFTKNGLPFLKMMKDSSPVRIDALQQLELMMRRPPPAAPPPAGGPRRGGGGGPPPAPRGWRAGGPPQRAGGPPQAVAGSSLGEAARSGEALMDPATVLGVPAATAPRAVSPRSAESVPVVASAGAGSVVASAGSVAAPAGSVAAPACSVAAPADSVAAPACSVAAPACSVAVPVGSVAAPVCSVAAPVDSVEAPAGSGVAPVVPMPESAVSVPAPGGSVLASDDSASLASPGLGGHAARPA